MITARASASPAAAIGRLSPTTADGRRKSRRHRQGPLFSGRGYAIMSMTRRSPMHRIAIPQAAIDRVLKRRDSLHVINDIDPARTAHVVVDLQNGFMAP